MPDPVIGQPNVAKPVSAAADGARVIQRFDQYGGAHNRNELLAWAEEGSYFKATNPTEGTGIAMGIQTAYSETANVLALMRSSSNTVRVIPHYVRFICTAAGATTTSSNLSVVVDTANRYNTGGTDLTTEIKNSASNLSPASVVDVLRFGAITANGVSAKRKLGRAVLKTQAAPCWNVGDELLLNFLTFGEGAHGLLSGAGAATIQKNFGPVVLFGANHSLLFHMWNPANATTAPSWECEFAWWER